MRAFIATAMIGSFAFDKDQKLLDYRLFPKKPEVIAAKLTQVREGKIIPEEKDIITHLEKSDLKEIVWDKQEEYKGFTCVYKKDNPGKKTLDDNIRKYAVELQWVTTQSEFNELLTKVNVLVTKEKLKQEKKDRLLMVSVGVLDELDKTINTLSERMREWYGFHFPEMMKLVQSHERFASLIAEFGRRENILDKDLKKVIDKSSGIPLSDEDITVLQQYAQEIKNLFAVKKSITKYIESVSHEVIPNMAAVAEPILASRLLAYGGGLEKLSRMPSSTIQLLGAEKALFRHLKGKGKAPKYGILFGHSQIQKAPKPLKGKVARLIASKISIASRMDHFSKEDKSTELKKDLDEAIKQVLREK